MKIKAKVLAPSIVAVILMLILSIVSFSGLHRLQQTIDNLVKQGMDHVVALNDLRAELLNANVAAYRLFASFGNYDEARLAKETEVILGQADKAQAGLQALTANTALPEAAQRELAALAEPLKKYRKSIAQAIDMAQSDISSGTGMMQAADKRFIEINSALGKIIDAEKKEAAQQAEDAISLASGAITTSAVLLVIALGVSLVLSVYIANKITAPLVSAIATASAIAGGKLTNRIEANGTDETADLLRALSAMQDNLRQLIGHIGTNADQTVVACKDMDHALKEINGAVANQNDATSAVAAAIEEMSVSVNNIRDNASQSLTANQASSQLATDGIHVIQQAFDAMSNIAHTVNEAANVVERVGNQSNEISAIVGVIRDVADQTNLLALNAAIEAARAGELGRGFAVVADEVRKLAEKTTTSAAEITRMIEAIQVSAHTAVGNIHAVVDQVQATASHADGARNSIERIHDSAAQSEGYARDISYALTEQSQASTLIAQNVEGITQMSEKNAISVQQAGQAMRGLEEGARALQVMIGRFAIL